MSLSLAQFSLNADSMRRRFQRSLAASVLLAWRRALSLLSMSKAVTGVTKPLEVRKRAWTSSRMKVTWCSGSSSRRLRYSQTPPGMRRISLLLFLVASMCFLMTSASSTASDRDCLRVS